MKTDAALDASFYEQNYGWDQSPEAIYKKLIRNPPDTPHYQKLILLANLKAAEASEKTAFSVAGYTKWLMILTAFITVGTVVQAIFAALTYLYPRTTSMNLP
jgi:hypothetical protein